MYAIRSYYEIEPIRKSMELREAIRACTDLDYAVWKKPKKELHLKFAQDPLAIPSSKLTVV